MEEFRKKLEKQFRLYTVFCSCSAAMFILLKLLTKAADDFAQGLVYGVFSGFMIVAVFNLARMYTALRNEEKLKEMYIQETDERNIAIQKESAKTAQSLSIMCIALAVIVSGFFSKTVCFTLCGAAVLEAVITLVVHAYYSKKM